MKNNKKAIWMTIWVMAIVIIFVFRNAQTW